MLFNSVIRGTLQVLHASKCISYCVSKCFTDVKYSPGWSFTELLHIINVAMLQNGWATSIHLSLWSMCGCACVCVAVMILDITLERHINHQVHYSCCNVAWGFFLTPVWVKRAAASKGHWFKYASSHWGASHPTVNPADWGLSQRLKERAELHCRWSR